MPSTRREKREINKMLSNLKLIYLIELNFFNFSYKYKVYFINNKNLIDIYYIMVLNYEYEYYISKTLF